MAKVVVLVHMKVVLQLLEHIYQLLEVKAGGEMEDMAELGVEVAVLHLIDLEADMGEKDSMEAEAVEDGFIMTA